MRLALSLIVAAGLVAALPAAGAAPDRSAVLKDSIARSMDLLNKAQMKFERQATCASCHNQIEPMLTSAVLRGKGLPVDETAFAHQFDASVNIIRGRHDYSLTNQVAGGGHAVTAPTLAALSDVKFPADENTDAAVVYLLSRQAADGSWPAVAVRFPHGVSNFDVTARAVRAIDGYAPPAMRKQADAAIARARAWVVATPSGPDNESLNYRLQGLVAAKAGASDVAKGRAQLLAGQQADGGWAQNPGMASDAYSTSASLVSLYKAGIKPTDKAYQRGIDYLLKTQAADGSWHVKAHALPIQPPIDAGFPYGQDQWISSWATAYAAQAMAYAL